ncbi:MAG: hypothetical protein AUJ12_08920 [Alphaproteobacteria bacterium CG1_02_46_17]|nr:MAG: hypothetical protein AUJ12_08920 [Alphaproteobacteria bacterium CG1_02_46_17]
MKKHQKQDYNALSADEVTQRLSDFYLGQLDFLRDKGRGLLRTTFGIMARTIRADVGALRDAALAKNGIEKIQADGPVCYNYLPDIVAATEARGSNAAALNVEGFTEMGGLQKARIRLDVAKRSCE